MELLVSNNQVDAAHATWLLAWFDLLPPDIPCPTLYGLRSSTDGKPLLLCDAVNADWAFVSLEEGRQAGSAYLELAPGPNCYFCVCENIHAKEENSYDAYIEVTVDTTQRIIEVLRALKAHADR
jgi:hypothetical protein